MPNASALQVLGIKKETTAGTYAAPTTADHGMLSLAEITWKAVEPRAKDEGLRGTMRGRSFGSYQTTSHVEVSLKGPVFAGSFGHILMAAFGTDTVAGAGPYTHTFSVADTTYPGVATYSLYNYDGANGSNAWGFVGCKLKSLSVEYDKANLLQFSADFVGHSRASQSAATLTVESGTGFGVLNGYTTAMTVAGSSDTSWEKFQWELDRGTEAVHSFNGARTPDVSAISVAPPAGTFSGSAFYDNQTNLNRFLNASGSTIVCDIGSTNPKLTITMTQPDWSSAEVKPGNVGDFQRLDIKGDMQYHATDLGVCKVVLTNSRSTTY